MFSSLNILFPRLCPGCRCVLQTIGLCAPCWKHLEFITVPFCIKCGEPFSFEGYADLCWKCQKFVPPFLSHRSLMRYTPLSKRLIFSLKHGRDRTLVPLFAQWLAPLATDFFIDVLIPVPLHWTRLGYRCFNQSALIAQQLAKLLNIPCHITGLKRVRRTPSQGKKNRYVRSQNIENAFRASHTVRNKHILLIDDVYTTGATLSACAETLLQEGAYTVRGLTISKVILGGTMKDSSPADPPDFHTPFS